jgi:hypothetical protein
MTTRRRIICAAFAAALSLSGCAHRVSSAGSGRWELRGAIADVTGDRLRIRHKSGQLVDLTLDARTKVTRDDKPADRDGLHPGVRVRIVVEPMDGGGQRADWVRLFGSRR